MAALSIYLDECVDHRLAARLRDAGIDVLTVVEASLDSLDDESQLEHATSTGRTLLTQNQIDFRRLHAAYMRAGKRHSGIILIPQTIPFDRFANRALLMVDWVSTFAQHDSRVFAWTELQQLLIHGLRLPTWDEAVVRDALGWRA